MPLFLLMTSVMLYTYVEWKLSENLMLFVTSFLIQVVCVCIFCLFCGLVPYLCFRVRADRVPELGDCGPAAQEPGA